MLLAYIDEIGEPGAFVSRTHERYNTSPAFGYAGFVIPEGNARRFGEIFTTAKRKLFKTELAEVEHPGRWERKGSAIFRPRTHIDYPNQLRVFNGLVRSMRNLQGSLFYYADEKPLGTPKQTQLNTVDRETAAMRESLNRICKYADGKDQNVMVLIDQINEKTRADRLPLMYGHILSRAAERPEMKRAVEPPMHVDSQLSSNIQFADWIAAAVTRAIEYQTIEDSPYNWIPDKLGDAMTGAFTHESKLRLWHRSIEDIHHSKVFHRERPLHPRVLGQRIHQAIPPEMVRKIRAASERSHSRDR